MYKRVVRIGTPVITPYRLRRLNERFVMTQPTIQKISDNYDVLLKTNIIISIKIFIK
jgi:hypothetical protein